METRSQRILILILFLFTTHLLWSQNTIGIPNIINYTKQVYSAGSQNWNIAQGKNGIMYFTNNDGLLSFDGTFWRLYKLPNKTIARSVAVHNDKQDLCRRTREIGYFFPDANGELEYTSLNKLILPKTMILQMFGIFVFTINMYFSGRIKKY
jgi:hypothetical protein